MNKKMSRKRKKYFIPALFSIFIAGLGQALKGDSKKGLKIMLWFYFGLPLVAMLSMIINSYLFLIVSAIIVILYPIIWTYNILDAFTYQVR